MKQAAADCGLMAWRLSLGLALQVRQKLTLAREMQKELLPTKSAAVPQAPQAVRMDITYCAFCSVNGTASAIDDRRQIAAMPDKA